MSHALTVISSRLGLVRTIDKHTYMWPYQDGDLRVADLLHGKSGLPEKMFQGAYLKDF